MRVRPDYRGDEVKFVLHGSGGYLLWHTKRADSAEAGKDTVRAALDDGTAYSAFQTMLRMQGCSPAVVDNAADWLPRAAYTTLLYCPASGQPQYSHRCDPTSIGQW